MKSDPRIAIVTNGNYFSRIILEPLLVNYRTNVVGVVLVEGDYNGHTGFRSLWRVGRKTALPYLAYKVILHLAVKAAQQLNPKAWIETKTMVQDLGLPSLQTVKVNSPEVYNWLQEKKPDLLISVSCPQRIRSKLLRLPRIAALNIHSSLLPRYAGLAPYYWVLVEGETQTGVTVHYMTERFDEGNILVQKSLPIPPGMSAFVLFENLAILGSKALLEAINLALEGNPGQPQDLQSRTYYSHPTWSSYLKLRQRGHVIARTTELFRALKKASSQRNSVQ